MSYDNIYLDFSKIEQDLIRIIDITGVYGYFVSERLKKAIEKERFTGMVFKELEEYNKRVIAVY